METLEKDYGQNKEARINIEFDISDIVKMLKQDLLKDRNKIIELAVIGIMKELMRIDFSYAVSECIIKNEEIRSEIKEKIINSIEAGALKDEIVRRLLRN